MPLQLDIVTEDDLKAFQQGTIDHQRSKLVEEVLRSDDRARACLEKICRDSLLSKNQNGTKEKHMSSQIMSSKANVSQLKTGIENRGNLADLLGECLADTYLLMFKTQAYHWNVVGPLFVSIHQLTESHYQDLFAAADEIAERVRTLGFPAPYSFREMTKNAALKEEQGEPTAAEMLNSLIADHEQLAKHLRETAEEAERLHDIVTADMLTARIRFHEKAVWMLKSIAS